MEQQIDEMARRPAAEPEMEDETLSVVRRMMVQASGVAAPVAPGTRGAQADATGSVMCPHHDPHRDRTLRGRAALPDLAAPLAPAPKRRGRVALTLPLFHPLARLSRGRAGRRGVTRPEPRTIGAKITGYRPGRRPIGLAALIAVMLWRPWLLPVVVFVTFWTALIVYLTLGPDRVSEIVQGRWEWFNARHPERAARLLLRVQRGADRIDGWLARLPERWSDGIYLPDLGRSEIEPDARITRPDPFERLLHARKAAREQGEHG